MIHLLKERKGRDVTTKCGQKASPSDTTVWWTDVTCPECKALMK